MFNEPLADKLNEPRMWNGKPWHWCSPKTGGKCKGAYRRHKPSKCKGIAGSKRNSANKQNSSNEKQEKQETPNKRVRLSKALETIISDGE